MRPLAALERFLERLFERPSARLFRTRLQPVQLQRRIERAMESDRLSGADRTLVPNRFRVHLHPDDLAGFGGMPETLAADLADGALRFARSHRYVVVDRPRVDLVADSKLNLGEIRVEAHFAEPERASPRPIADGPRNEPHPGEPPAVPLGDHTMIFEAPVIAGPRARLREIRPDRTQREIDIDGSLLTIGRARDNGLVLHDDRVSRYHARLQSRRGALILTDLGSTNGSRVNGQPVDEVALGEGDRIEIGDTVLLVESLPEA
jgi:hypothetical protein